MSGTSQLKHANDSSFNIKRVRLDDGFKFVDNNGKKLSNKQLERIEKLVIPPMWRDVLICEWDDGHIQATGRDSKGRKQYIYHSEWERQQQQEKFSRMHSFGKKLPTFRKKAMADCQREEWCKKKVLGLLVLILDDTGIRIGNKRYTEENNTYGLTTLRRKHLELKEDSLLFSYSGKSNQLRSVHINDEALVKFIKTAAEQPGYEIFRYQNNDSTWENIDSDDVNSYIQGIAGTGYYSKDFRTWVATRLAVDYYPAAVEEKKHNPQKKMTNILIRIVADEIGNTPNVCKDYYIHPEVMRMIDLEALPEISSYHSDREDFGYSAAEKLVLDVVSD
ncbi:hypothetical protein OS175_06085 [Marinicella sp. S1101]|uniref:DNA topoisomerase IB n=1 Tax=Marinicella marina TaxID=2996016 RepID=UPI002260DBB9|nr:hypothetical protein [Marinicella marina]MCX7553441.1 hypothetical protein [Marinicella marina]MDJ1140065.1 hypothetical protein [Marinicella marina]